MSPVHVRRRRIALLLAVLVIVVLAFTVRTAWAALSGPISPAASAAATPTNAANPAIPVNPAPAGGDAAAAKASPAASAGPTAAPKPSPAAKQGAPGPSGQTTPVRILRLSGNLASKSVVASVKGQVFAQNMMYQHSVSVFGPDGALVRTIPDSVDLATFGIEGHEGRSQGAPVEMDFSPDGKFAWVSNYHMYGKGFSKEPGDSCTSGEGYTDSFVYKIDTSTHEIVKAVQVGVVPKYLAVTPDGSKVVVSNWCSMDLDVIDTATDKVVATVPSTGKYPRGIAISKDSRTAFVALMGSDKVVALDLRTNTLRDFAQPGSKTRHLSISPDGKRLYATNSRSNDVAEIDTATGEVLRKVTVGKEPRSMAISADGQALYVVNYDASTMSKIRTSDLTVTGTYPTDGHPIGITYEPTQKRVWVACYGGTILVFDDSRLKG
jgi:YVTN family beta-propeller protein